MVLHLPAAEQLGIVGGAAFQRSDHLIESVKGVPQRVRPLSFSSRVCSLGFYSGMVVLSGRDPGRVGHWEEAGLHILYVEDNEPNLRLVERVARMGAHRLTALVDGQAALDLVAQREPDLMIVDVQLRGGLDGLTVVRRLREGGATLPIIAVTAYAMSGDRDRCMAAGCDAYLPKPIPIPELVELIQLFATRIRRDPSG